jgi:hypothetical protein
MQAGNDTYDAATQYQQFDVALVDQTITFSIPDKTVGDAPFPITATVDTNLPMTYASSSSKITLVGNQVTVVKAGRATITASQAGDDNYVTASKAVSFCIRPAKPAVTVTGLGGDTPVLTSSAASGNQWFRNGDPLPGATDVTYTVTQAGLYKVQSIVDDCMSAFSPEQSLVITEVERESEQLLSVYPNPTTDHLIVAFGGMPGWKSVSIQSIDGKTMFARNTQEELLTFDVSGFSAGIYLVRIDGNPGGKTIRFVKK